MNLNDQCPKCRIGAMTEAQYAPDTKDRKPPENEANHCLSECPTEEHLHLGCSRCGFFEAQPVRG
jgi:hypothetical protein